MPDLSGPRSPYFNIYGNTPSLPAAIFFIIAFSIVTFTHLGLLIRTKKWYWAVLLLGSFAEILGWVGRLWSHYNVRDISPATGTVFNMTPFLINQVCLIMAPTFWSAGVYAALGLLIRYFGNQYSLLKANTYLFIFITVDIISVVCQAVGGGFSSGNNPIIGARIFTAGVAFQLLCMLVFTVFALVFFNRLRKSPEARKLAQFEEAKHVKLFIIGMWVATVLIIIRGAYRTAELTDGWQGYLVVHEGYFIGLDAVLMLLCDIALLSFYFFGSRPGRQNRISSDDGRLEKGPAMSAV